MTVAGEERPRTRRQAVTSPGRYLARMIGFVVAVAIVAALLGPGLLAAFAANPALNSVILAVLAFGIAFSFRAVMNLAPDIAWMNALMGRGAIPNRRPRLLTPVARALDEHGGRFTLTAPVMRSLLDGISDRLTEGREISRYLIGLLIFLGLLGTFWGLLETVNAAGGVIRGLSLDGTDVGAMFRNLKDGLETPLLGMGTAFSSSLFGLAGSLTLGFLELQVGQAQNRFFNDLEDWLSSNTVLTQTQETGAGVQAPAAARPLELTDVAAPAYIEAVVAQTAENLETLLQVAQSTEEQRLQADTVMATIAERLGTLNENLTAQRGVLISIAESQASLKPILLALHEMLQSNRIGNDEEVLAHLRNLDATARRLVDETATARNQLSKEIRHEIKLLARTIAAVADETQPR